MDTDIFYPTVAKRETVDTEWIVVEYCATMKEAIEKAKMLGLPKGLYGVIQAKWRETN